jgi:hypothetical protein
MLHAFASSAEICRHFYIMSAGRIQAQPTRQGLGQQPIYGFLLTQDLG